MSYFGLFEAKNCLSFDQVKNQFAHLKFSSWRLIFKVIRKYLQIFRKNINIFKMITLPCMRPNSPIVWNYVDS